jgi:hypothetical protein
MTYLDEPVHEKYNTSKWRKFGVLTHEHSMSKAEWTPPTWCGHMTYLDELVQEQCDPSVIDK